jgi:peptidoglycan hydrolase-like protein with peptidoglycan-binding domain
VTTAPSSPTAHTLGRAQLDPEPRPDRRWPVLLAALMIVVLAAAAVGVVARTRAAQTKSGEAGNVPGVFLATVRRQTLESQEQVDGTLGYADSYRVVNQYSPPLSPAEAAKAQHAVAAAQTAYKNAVAQADYRNQVDADKVAADSSQLSQDQQKYNSDGCVGHPSTAACSQDQQAINTDQSNLTRDQQQQGADQRQGQASVDSARANLVQAQDNQATGGSGGPGSGGPAGGASGGSAQVTWLPAQGDVIDRGKPVYRVNGVPIPLLFGDEPISRKLTEGVSGHDVQELEDNLLALGYGGSGSLEADGNFAAADTAAVKRWQQALGAPVTGVVNAGDVVVLPGAARISTVDATQGGSVAPGQEVLKATSTTRQVAVQLDATQQSDVAVGNQVTITLPGNRTTPGAVSSVGKVATTPQSGPGSSSGSSSSTPSSGSSTATIQVLIAPTDPAATGSLDAAPVHVAITTASVKDALVVPVTALLATSAGYELEVVSANGQRHPEQVTLGLFDDAAGLVQVSGSGLQAGQRVVVAPS